jgi:hypothetical protein
MFFGANAPLAIWFAMRRVIVVVHRCRNQRQSLMRVLERPTPVTG